MADDQSPKIQIDSDWKAEAQREKERLRKEAEARSAEAARQAEATGATGAAGAAGAATGRQGDRRGEMPPANFQTLVRSTATQALFAMGAIPDPQTGQRMAHLELAKHHIDMLGVLEDKTKGNLSDEEKHALATTLYELRSRYIQLATQSMRKD